MRQFLFFVSLKWKLVPTLVFLIGALSASAQDDQGLAPVSGSYAITGATIVTAPGQKLDRGTVLVKDGLIVSVGPNVTIPPDAIVIKADSMFVYAGFIDGFSHVGVATPKVEKKEKPKYPGNPSPDEAGITPQNDVRQFINPKDRSITDLRNQGFTVSQVVPQGNLLPGQAAIVLLGDMDVDRMTLVPNAAMYSELSGASGVYPATIMAVMAKWRELYKQASMSKIYETTYTANPTGLERPQSDRVLQAFYPVIDRKQPVLFKATKIIETQRVIGLKNELGFQLIIGDLKEGWPIINKIRNSGAKVFLSLELPDEMKNDDGKSATSSEERKALDKRKKESIANYAAQASAFAKAGIGFGFSANSVQPKDIKNNLRRMIGAGLSEETALASLTTTPAQMLGLSNRMGTIEKGKLANLVVVDQSYFAEKSKIKYVFIEGNLHIVEDTPKSGNGKKADIAGTWTYNTETPQGKGTGKLVINNDGGNYSGTITNNFSGKETSVNEITLSGNSLSFNYSIDIGGNQLKIEVSATVKEDSFEGSMTAGQFGTFPMNGTKDPK